MRRRAVKEGTRTSTDWTMMAVDTSFEDQIPPAGEGGTVEYVVSYACEIGRMSDGRIRFVRNAHVSIFHALGQTSRTEHEARAVIPRIEVKQIVRTRHWYLQLQSIGALARVGVRRPMLDAYRFRDVCS